MSANLILPKRQTNGRSPNVITPSAGVLKPTREVDRYRPANQSVLSRIKTTAVSWRKNRAKINGKCFIGEKKQHSSNQTAETAVPL